MNVGNRSSRQRYGLVRALSLAAALLFVQTISAAHELEHALHHHDGPCALFLHAGELSGAPLAQAPVVATAAFDASVPLHHAAPSPRQRHLGANSARAPPRFS